MNKFHKISKLCLMFGFILFLFMPSVLINRVEGKMSSVEKRYLASFPDLFDEEGNFITEGFTTNIENWLNDNIGLRDWFVKIYTNVMINGLHLSSNEKIEMGKDGWYFYTGDNNMKIADGTYPLTEEDVEEIVNVQQTISDKLESQGKQYILILTPSRVSVYPEMIIGGKSAISETPIDVVENALREKSDVLTIALKKKLLEAKEDTQVFFKTDTHWNWEGAYIAYSEIIKQLNEVGVIDSEVEEVTTYESEYLGEMGAMLGNEAILGTEMILKTELVNKDAVQITSGALYESIKGVKDKNWYSVQIFQNDSVEENVAVMFGSSRFATWGMPELLAEHFSTFVLIWGRSCSEEIIQIVDPDVVLYDIGERYLNVLSDWTYDFSQQLPEEYSSEFISENTTRVVQRNIIQNVEIVVKNTGITEWSSEKGIGLSIWQDGVDAYRVSLPEGVIVNPGEQYTFVFSNFEMPSTPYTSLVYQMVQEGVTYFGERKFIPITVVGEMEYAGEILSIQHHEKNGVDTVSIEVKNTSNFSWSEDYRIRLAVFGDGRDSGIRLNINQGESVLPGETCTFELEMTSYLNSHESVTVGMVFEGVVYFGEWEEIK